MSLEQLRVVNPDDIHVSANRVLVYLTPTIPHCSMSTLIGKSTSPHPPPVLIREQACPFASDSSVRYLPASEWTSGSKKAHTNRSMRSTSS